MKTGCIAITGASGFLGSHLVRHFHGRGWQVRALVRDPGSFEPPASAVSVHHCHLPDDIDPQGIEGVDVLIHAAYNTRFRKLSEAMRVNEEGTRHVLEIARTTGVERFVFLSTLSAHERALSYYGRSKLALERALDSERDLCLRLGLVLAREGEGLFQRLRKTVASARFIPVFDGGDQPLQTLHVADLCLALDQALERDLTGTFNLAEPEGLTYRAFLAAIAARLGRKPTFVSIPTTPTLWALRLIEKLRIPSPVSSENLLGLRALEHAVTVKDLGRLDVRARSATESLDDLIGSVRSV